MPFQANLLEMKTGIIFCGHGTKSQKGLESFFKVYAALEKKLTPTYELNYGFIEYTQPGLQDAIEEHIGRGIQEIVILPALLFTGVHITHDIPFVAQSVKKSHPGITIKLAPTLDLSDKVIKLCLQLIHKQLIAGTGSVEKKHLLVVGVGSSLPEANVKIASLTRMLWEKIPFAYAGYSFISKMTFPSVDTELERLKRISKNDIIVLPIILFPGIYLESVAAKVEIFSQTYDGKISVCSPFDESELLIDAFMHRLRETLDGQTNFLNEFEMIESARK